MPLQPANPNCTKCHGRGVQIRKTPTNLYNCGYMQEVHTCECRRLQPLFLNPKVSRIRSFFRSLVGAR